MGMRIILAEDNELNSIYMRKVLQDCGNTVLHAQNGEEVLQLLREGPADLILMDVQMPILNGVEATRRIRAHDGSAFDPKVPIIALTAFAMAEERKRFLEEGMDDVLTKPTSIENLQQVLAAFANTKKH